MRNDDGQGTWAQWLRSPRVTAAAVAMAMVASAVSRPPAAGAQAPDARQATPGARDTSGWMGVGLRAGPCDGEPAECVRPVVGSVILGSPAHRAGIRIGDRILTVGGDAVRGGPHDPAFRTLRPGSPVQIVVRRSGRRVRLRVVPRERPDSLAVVRLAPSNPRVSPGGAYVLALPEARIRIEDPSVPGVPSLRDATPRVLRMVPTAREGELSRELVAARIEALREAMDQAARRTAGTEGDGTPLERRLVPTREGGREESQRGEGPESWSWSFTVEGEAAHRAARQWRRWIDDSLRGHLESLHDSVLAAARSHMDSLAREAAREFARTPGAGESSVMVVGGGRDRAAGAEFQPMSPELAEFFQGADRGLLVLRVLPETPAARLGLRPGDVVVEVGGRRIRSVTALRAALAGDSPEPVEVKWMRKGQSLSGRIQD